MTTDGRPPASKDPKSADTDPTDPPVYREAATPEEVEEQKGEEESEGGPA
jgi:hypothetical protein